MARGTSLTVAEVRRMQLEAQGFGRRRPTGRIDRRHLRRVFEDVGIVQIDSVNVLCRSQYMPFFSRLGAYDTSVLDAMAAEHHEIVEYWFHMASWAPVGTWPKFAWRMRNRDRWRKFLSRTDAMSYVETSRSAVAGRSPVTAGEIEKRDRPKEPWWDWSHTKRALEYLFHLGEITAKRRPNFEREYARLDHVLPDAIITERDLTDETAAERWCLLEAARRLSVATVHDLADYPRMNIRTARTRVRELVAEGQLEEVEVEGWDAPAFRHKGAALPRRITARALLSPFDSLVWHRERLLRVFDFHYRIEIYVPKAKRVHGYYVLPFLLGDELVARVDLKADRARGTLLVRSAHLDKGDPVHVATELAAELDVLTGWLGLNDIHVQPSGDLSPALSAAVG